MVDWLHFHLVKTSLMCIIHEHQTRNHIRNYNDTLFFSAYCRTRNAMSFPGIYICSEVKNKGSFLKMKCCLILMRCLCWLQGFSFYLLFYYFQITLNVGAYTLFCLSVTIKGFEWWFHLIQYQNIKKFLILTFLGHLTLHFMSAFIKHTHMVMIQYLGIQIN